MMRFFFLASAVTVAGAILMAAPARAQTVYPYCSTAGVQIGRDCSFSTLQQCQASTRGMGTDCERNSNYKEPAVVAPAPMPAPAAAPPQKGRKKGSPADTKS